MSAQLEPQNKKILCRVFLSMCVCHTCIPCHSCVACHTGVPAIQLHVLYLACNSLVMVKLARGAETQ